MPIVINGGEPLEGCPKSWDEAHKWEKQVNGNKEEILDVVWKYDCGFKLDYDGGLLYISSRFYPPKEHYGETWDGTVTIYLAGNTINKKAFDCKTLEELRKQVEGYVSSLADKIKSVLGAVNQKEKI